MIILEYKLFTILVETMVGENENLVFGRNDNNTRLVFKFMVWTLLLRQFKFTYSLDFTYSISEFSVVFSVCT